MREISVEKIREAVEKMCGEIAFVYPKDVLQRLEKGAQREDTPRAQGALQILLKNAEIARDKHIPICQDTGMAVVWLKIGQEVHFVEGSLQEAIQEGVRQAYRNQYLRNSVVDDPLFERKNTSDNTPAVIYTEIVDGDRVEIEVAAKGFGSENMSRIQMCKPAQGRQGVVDFVLETIRLAGPNACPPMVVGVGIGGTFDYAAVLAKKALLRPLDQRHAIEEYARLEEELLERANQLNIGPLGLKGKCSVLAVNIEHFPTHIAGMPVAVNINCHVLRHDKVVL